MKIAKLLFILILVSFLLAGASALVIVVTLIIKDDPIRMQALQELIEQNGNVVPAATILFCFLMLIGTFATLGFTIPFLEEGRGKPASENALLRNSVYKVLFSDEEVILLKGVNGETRLCGFSNKFPKKLGAYEFITVKGEEGGDCEYQAFPPP